MFSLDCYHPLNLLMCPVLFRKFKVEICTVDLPHRCWDSIGAWQLLSEALGSWHLLQMEWIWKYVQGKKFIKHCLLDDLIINILKFKIQYSRVRWGGMTRDTGEGRHPRRHWHWSQRQEHQSQPQDHNPEPQSHWLPDPYHRFLQSEICWKLFSISCWNYIT